jgi:predicted RNA-binding protein associated with RNAse of E/G family
MAPRWSEAGPLPPGLPVEIEYARVGGEVFVYRQHLVHASPAAIVTLQTSTPLSRPKRVNGRVVLEPGSPVVWFTFEGRWHDIGAFHLVDGTFTGWYANVLTPVELGAPTATAWRWRTTDLCLDVWRDDRGVDLLDADELRAAEAQGDLAGDTATRARAEAERLLAEARNDEWPPALVGEWPLEAARRRVGR